MNRLPRISLARVLGASLAVLIAATVHGHETSPPGQEPRVDDLRPIVQRIAGGASLLHDLAPGRATKVLHDRAHHFEEMVEGGRAPLGHLAADWRKLRDAYVAASRTAGWQGRDRRPGFLLFHLREDFAAGDRILGAVPGSTTTPGGVETEWFLQSETCVGTNPQPPKPCSPPRGSISFRIPRDVVVIRRILGEWRDFGRGVRAQVFLDDRLVWETDVGKNWDTDARALELRVRPGSTLALRSSNGDPLWVRRFMIDYEGAAGHRH